MARHTDDHIELGLQELAWAGGIAAHAVTSLQKNHGITVDRTTLVAWADKHADRYEHHREAKARALAEQAEHIARRAAAIELEMLDSLEGKAKHMDPKDLGATLRNISTSKAINIDKASALLGRPTHITEHRDAEAILRSLFHKVGVIDTTAEEDEPHELTDGT